LPNQGWKVSKIIQQVNGRTENRATGKPNFDINMEFFLGLDEFCQEKHYWWRRKSFSFLTQQGVQSYDLASNSTGSANAGDAEEIEEAFFVNATPLVHPSSVHPAFTAREWVASLYGDAVSGTIPFPGYFLDGFQNFVFTQAPQSAFTCAATYWAVPMVTDTAGALGNPPPLVPPFLHFGLVYMLERRVYEYLYGQNDPRFATSNQRYEDFKKIAAKSKQFSSAEAIHSSMQGASVTASGGRGFRGSVTGSR
jgi:hypothetical protein